MVEEACGRLRLQSPIDYCGPFKVGALGPMSDEASSWSRGPQMLRKMTDFIVYPDHSCHAAFVYVGCAVSFSFTEM